MDTALPQIFLFVLDRNLAKANYTGNHVCTSCDRVVLGQSTNPAGHFAIFNQTVSLIRRFSDFKSPILFFFF